MAKDRQKAGMTSDEVAKQKDFQAVAGGRSFVNSSKMLEFA